MSSNRETKGIRVVFILEIIGKPPEHLVETLNKLIDAMDKEKGVKVIGKNIKEVVELKNQKGFFTTFAEVEMEIDEVLQTAVMMFKYMPANIEIIEPELIALSNTGWSDILSELTRRLHAYDEVARVVQMENAKLQRELRELTPEEEVKNLGKIGEDDLDEDSGENIEKEIKKS